ncbi:MAG: hypothetical protein ACREV7_19245 [Steroidobacteraceae bacterium]
MEVLTVKTPSLIVAAMLEDLSRAVTGLCFTGFGGPSIALNAA